MCGGGMDEEAHLSRLRRLEHDSWLDVSGSLSYAAADHGVVAMCCNTVQTCGRTGHGVEYGSWMTSGLR